jgi:hypothetical protein
MSSDGVATLQLIAAKVDLIKGLDQIPEANSLASFFKMVGKITRADGTATYAVPLQLMAAYFDVADSIRPRLSKIGWRAVHHDVELQYTALQIANKERSPEGLLFKRLMDSLPE